MKYNKLFKESSIGQQYYKWLTDNNPPNDIIKSEYNKYYQRFYYTMKKNTEKYKTMKKTQHIKYYKSISDKKEVKEKLNKKSKDFISKKKLLILEGKTYNCVMCNKHYITQNGYNRHIISH